jgi:hypothetical protein
MSDKLKVKRIAPKVFHVHARNQEMLAMSFLRFQEYYESPKFRKRLFTMKEFKKWYKKKYGKFSYCKDWAGFNVPGWVFETFRAGHFDPLNRRERNLLKALYRVTADCYVIGTYKGNSQALDHELTHALYYVDPEYRAKVCEILRKAGMSKKNAIFSWLRSNKYSSAVFEDEFNAYLVNDSDYLKSEGIKLKKFKRVRTKLQNLFLKYSLRNKL